MRACAGKAARRRAKRFADGIFTLLFAVELVLLGLALVFTPSVISVLAPGIGSVSASHLRPR